MAKLFANSGDPDQMPYSAAADIGLFCLPKTTFGCLQTKVDLYGRKKFEIYCIDK